MTQYTRTIGVKSIDRNGLKVTEYEDWAIADMAIEACVLAMLSNSMISNYEFKHVISPDINGWETEITLVNGSDEVVVNSWSAPSRLRPYGTWKVKMDNMVRW